MYIYSFSQAYDSQNMVSKLYNSLTLQKGKPARKHSQLKNQYLFTTCIREDLLETELKLELRQRKVEPSMTEIVIRTCLKKTGMWMATLIDQVLDYLNKLYKTE